VIFDSAFQFTCHMACVTMEKALLVSGNMAFILVISSKRQFYILVKVLSEENICTVVIGSNFLLSHCTLFKTDF
jgi:hypothetical protein